jgi:RHS repeat-associated protein
MDAETGFYYYGARYLDPKTSRWISADPALGEYIPGAGKGSEGLAGMGGVYNTVNLHLYHYAGNNPVKYVDPDGLSNEEFDIILQKASAYLKSECDKYIEKLKADFSISGRGTLSVNFEKTFNGVKVKGNFAGVLEYDSSGKRSFNLEAGLDFGAGTPWQSLLSTGADATIGLRASFGEYKERNDGEFNFGIRTVSLAVDANAEFLGPGVKFELRKEIMNFDTPSRRPQFTFFNSNNTKFGVRQNRQIGQLPGIGTINIIGGGRINNF